MSSLSLVEAEKKYGISRKTLDYWVKKGKIPFEHEYRGNRQVIVVDDEILAQHLQARDVQDDAYIDENEAASMGQEDQASFRQQANGIQLVSFYQQQIALRDEKIVQLYEENKERDQRLIDLSKENGRLSGELSELRVRLDEKDAQIQASLVEIQEWKREIAVAREEVAKARRSWFIALFDLFRGR